MRERTLVVIAALFLIASAAYADGEAQLARYPAPSPDGKTLALSYQGDIWTVPIAGGRATRLTVHAAYDYMPVWSPDGSQIAFSSDRFGNDDIYVIPAGGGEAQRLTYMSADDIACGWTPDGKTVLFCSNRDWSAHRVPVIYSIPRTGGTPTLLMKEYGNEGTISPDGKWLAYSNGYRSYWWRKDYRGAGNNDIWIWNRETGEYRQLTDHLGNDAWPMWSGDGSAIYYVSDAGGIDNIWRVEIAGGNKTQLTNHQDRVRYPNISRDGSVIAYELGTDIYLLPTGGGEPARLAIVAPSDSKFNSVERLTMSNQADEMEPSPDNDEIALVVRGEIFAVREDGSYTNRLTELPARDNDIIWNTEGTALYFLSDREGNYDLYMIESDDPDQKDLSRALAFKTTRLTTDPLDEHSIRLSPDGKKLAFIRGQADLHVIDLETKQDKLLLPGWSLNDYEWSPDGRWIAIARDDAQFNNDIWIFPAEGGEPVNVTMHPDDDASPAWSPDGRKLAFISKRSSDRGSGDNYDVYLIYLRQEDYEKTAEDWALEKEAKKNEKKPEGKAEGKEKKEGEEEKPKLEVKIDFENIHQRVRPVTAQVGNMSFVGFSPDSESLIFTSDNSGGWELWSVKLDGSEVKQLTRGGTNPASIRWSKDGKKIYMLRSGGVIQSIGADGSSPTGISFQARMTIDHPAERMQKYEEAWRVLNLVFYDPNFHGSDWQAMRGKFRPWAQVAVEVRDFNDVVNMMFGELNASHMGIRGPFANGPRDNTGMLGLEFDETHSGPGLKITTVLKDGPCAKAASKLEPGEYLLEIDGQAVSPAVNIHNLLVDTVGKKVALTVAKSPDGADKHRVIVRPAALGEINQLLYERFVDQRRAIVHKLSEGKIGYLHVQVMGQPSLERFERELFSEADGKDAIVIDVRNNGGGWTTDMMLAMLQVRPHAYTIPRNGPRGYPVSERLPLYAWWKPVVVLCNEYSYSNAEIFSWAIKVLKRGLVIGQQTSGSVISTGGYGLIDGSYVRTPGRGWYVYGSGINQEHNGCPPDIVVIVQPGDEEAGIDRQLERAVEELKKQLAGSN